MPFRQFLVAAALALSALPASAHKIPPGVYAEVPYNNNPFLFCTLGMPEHGWVRVNPALGLWTPISQYYNPMWTATYEYICPAGFRPAGGGKPYRPGDSAATF